MIAMSKVTIENVLKFSQPNGQDSTSNSSFKYKEIQPKIQNPRSFIGQALLNIAKGVLKNMLDLSVLNLGL